MPLPDLGRTCLLLIALAWLTPGYAQAQTFVLKSFEILTVPAPPPTQTMWDNVINIFRVHPDIEVCVTTASGRICADVCNDTEAGSPHRPPCDRPIGPRGLRLARSGRFLVEAWDLDPDGRQQMASGEISVTDPCLPAEGRPQGIGPCEIATPRGPLTIRFTVSFEGALGAPPPLLRAPAPAGGGVPPRQDVQGDLSDLRDADNCRGSDEVFPSPQGTVFTRLYRNYILGWSADADQYYGLASLVASIPDQQTRARVKARVERRIDIERGDLPIYLDVVRDFESSQSWHAAFLKIGESFAGKLIGAGLDRLVPAIGRPGLATEVERWIYKKLASDALADEAIDLMFRNRNVTVECVMNELAKRGFEDAAGQ